MSMPLIAIVTPVLNGAKYLPETMECVQALDYPSLVHVVHDNASTDGTAEIAARYAGRRVPVVFVRAEQTRPMAENWNAALRHVPSEARYFWLLCADDILAPHAMRQLVSIAEADRDIQLVGCQWRAEGLCGAELPRDQCVFEGSDILRRYLRRETMVLSGMNVLFRRSLIPPERGFYDTAISSFDSDANIRACIRGKYGFVHEELLYWRQHAENATHAHNTSNLDFDSEWLMILDRYFSHALGFNEYLHCRRTFRYHFLRRVLKLMGSPDGRRIARRHLEILRAHGDGMSMSDLPLALLDWLAYAIRGQRWRVGLPRRTFEAIGSGMAAAGARY